MTLRVFVLWVWFVFGSSSVNISAISGGVPPPVIIKNYTNAKMPDVPWYSQARNWQEQYVPMTEQHNSAATDSYEHINAILDLPHSYKHYLASHQPAFDMYLSPSKLKKSSKQKTEFQKDYSPKIIKCSSTNCISSGATVIQPSPQSKGPLQMKMKKVKEFFFPYYHRPKYRYPFYDIHGNGRLLYGFGDDRLFQYTVFHPLEGYHR